MSDVKEKIPLVEGASGEAFMQETSSRINAISIQGVSYYLNTDLDDEFMNDFHDLPGEELVNKYGLREAEVVDAEKEAQAYQEKQSS